jgi:hypothetical protein
LLFEILLLPPLLLVCRCLLLLLWWLLLVLLLRLLPILPPPLLLNWGCLLLLSLRLVQQFTRLTCCCCLRHTIHRLLLLLVLLQLLLQLSLLLLQLPYLLLLLLQQLLHGQRWLRRDWHMLLHTDRCHLNSTRRRPGLCRCENRLLLRRGRHVVKPHRRATPWAPGVSHLLLLLLLGWLLVVLRLVHGWWAAMAWAWCCSVDRVLLRHVGPRLSGMVRHPRLELHMLQWLLGWLLYIMRVLHLLLLWRSKGPRHVALSRTPGLMLGRSCDIAPAAAVLLNAASGVLSWRCCWWRSVLRWARGPHVGVGTRSAPTPKWPPVIIVPFHGS